MPDAPRKPRLTKRRIFGIVTTVIALWLAWQVYDIITGKPDPKVDYATPYYELMAAGQPEGENAWPLFVDVVSQIGGAYEQAIDDALAVNPDPDLEDIDALPFFESMSIGPFRAERWQIQFDLLEDLEARGLFASLSRMTAMARCVAPARDPDAFSTHPFYDPPLTAMRKVAAVQRARMRIAAHEGRWDEFLQYFDESLAFSRLIAFQPSLLCFLIAESNVRSALDEVIASSIEYRPPETCYPAIRSIIHKQLPLPSIAIHFEGQRLIDLDSLQHTYSSSGRLPLSAWGKFRDGSWTPEIGSVEIPVGESLAVVIPGHAHARRILEDRYDEALMFLEANAGDLLTKQFGPSTSKDSLPFLQVVHRTNGLPPVDWLIRDAALLDYRVESIQVFLAVEHYCARNGGPPESLQELVPDYLAEVPIDRLNGKRFAYRLIADDPSGRTYLLYSLGLDGQDDSERPLGLRESVDVRTKGIDWLINRPRPLR